MKDCLPNFLLIGAEKAGTTWLDLCLRSHSQCFMAETKEIHFFNRYTSNLEVSDTFSERGLDWYGKFFADAGKTHVARGESTPLYLSDPMAARRIAATVPEVRLVAILRDPVFRAHSQFRMIRHKGQDSSELKALIESNDVRVVGRGRYVQHLRRFTDLFPRENVHLIVAENMSFEPRKHFAQLGQFLGLAPDGFVIAQPTNTAAGHWFPVLDTLGVRLARMLWVSPLTIPLARLMKRSGLYAAVKRLNRKPAQELPLHRDERVRLADLYARDNESLAVEFGVDISAWTIPDSSRSAS